VRTVFNILGPLSNPAEPPFHVIGAYSLATAHLMADALAGMNIRRAFVIHGCDGWDEPTPVGPFDLLEVHEGRVRYERRSPADFGLATCAAADLAGSDAAGNAAALRAVLSGTDRGAHRDALLLGRHWPWKSRGPSPHRVLPWRAPPPRSTVVRPWRCWARWRALGRAHERAGFSLRHGRLERAPGAGRARAPARGATDAAGAGERAATGLETVAAGFDVIAELKLRSPALGALAAATADLDARIAGYAAHGAAAVSVLTEPERFDGALEHLERATRVLQGRIPAMRKDFLVDPYQVAEARVAGAGGCW